MKSFSLYQKTGLLYSLVLLLFSIVAFIAAPFIIKFYLGIDYQPALNTIRILSVIILVGGLNYYYGIIGLVNMSKEKYFTRSVWTAGLVSLMLCAVLAPGLKANGAAIAMVIAESLLFVQIFMHRKKIQT